MGRCRVREGGRWAKDEGRERSSPRRRVRGEAASTASAEKPKSDSEKKLIASLISSLSREGMGAVVYLLNNQRKR